MKMTFLSLVMILSAPAFALQLTATQKLAPIVSLNSDGFSVSHVVTVKYRRLCQDKFAGILNRIKIEAGRRVVEVGVVLEESDQGCKMNGTPPGPETRTFVVNSELVLELRQMIDPSGEDVTLVSNSKPKADPK